MLTSGGLTSRLDELHRLVSPLTASELDELSQLLKKLHASYTDDSFDWSTTSSYSRTTSAARSPATVGRRAADGFVASRA